MKQSTWVCLLLTLCAAILTGCRFGNLSNTSSADATIPAVVTIPPGLTLPPPETPQVQPTTAPSATPAVTSTLMPTATVQTVPNQPATTTANNVNLRQGPGTLFTILGQIKEGTKITVIGRAAGNDWLFVDTGNRQGWISVAFTSLYNTPALATVPEKVVTGVEIIRGRIAESNGKGVEGIEFAAFQGKEDSNPPDTRAHSLASGDFYFYLPATASGTWRISLTAYDCKSRVVDEKCNLIGAIQPRFLDIQVPGDEPVQFKYAPK